MADAGRSKSKSRKRVRTCTTQKKQNANTSMKVCIQERRRSARISERGAEPSSDNNPEEMELDYSAISERPRAAVNSSPSSQSLKAQKKTKKKKRNTVIIKNVVSESDSEKEVIEVADEGECSNPGSSDLGNGGSTNKTRVNKGVPLLGEMSYKGWTKDQEIALHNAYYTIKPIPNFWKEIAKLFTNSSIELVEGELCADGLPGQWSSADKTPLEHLDISHVDDYGVSPYELDKRIRDLLEKQQEERISELEVELKSTEIKLHAKERELKHWKE